MIRDIVLLVWTTYSEDDPLLPWIAEIEDSLLDLDPDFQGEVRDLLDEEMDEAEGDPLGGEGTSAQPHPQSKAHNLKEKNLLKLCHLPRGRVPPYLRVAMVEEMGEMK